MKLAILHCRTTQGWALEVCKDLIIEELSRNSFSDIKIFTSYSELSNITINNNKIEIITALPQRLNNFFKRNTQKKISILHQIFDYRNLIFFSPILMKIISYKVHKYKPINILISSFAITKNIEQCKNRKQWIYIQKNIHTTLYLHSPMQYIRSHSSEYQKKLKGRKWVLFKLITPYLRKRDKKYTSYDKIYSNSNFTKIITKEIYDIDSEVKYPKVNQIYFNENIIEKPKEYIICIWRIVKFVREIDRIIDAFNKTGYPLIIIGSWPDEQELKAKSKSNISFTWRNPPNMIDIIKNAKWAINLTKESFWLSTAECLCLGIPVLWYSQWATPELVDEASGILIKNKNQKEIIEWCKLLLSTKRNRKAISTRARKIFTPK